MNWKLVDIKQETNHRFLNFFTLFYEVDGRPYEYYLASRKGIEDLRALHKKGCEKPDGVIILLYQKDGDDYRIALTEEFRPPFNRYFTSVPAGLVEKGEDILEAAKREANEEIGVKAKNLRLLFPPSSTSEGMSDELNCVVIGEIEEKGDKHLEGNEDISLIFASRKEVREKLDDPNRIFPLPGRLCLELLLRILEEKR
ncbi:MAG: NUDIX hydrolase [Bacilli bacterium]|nr:NUDIX hydrolase [Bacilli bacterium]